MKEPLIMQTGKDRHLPKKFVIVLVAVVMAGAGASVLYHHMISNTHTYNYLPVSEGAELVMGKQSFHSSSYLYILFLNVTGNESLFGSWKSSEPVRVSIGTDLPFKETGLLPIPQPANGSLNGTFDYFINPSTQGFPDSAGECYEIVFSGNPGTVVTVTETFEVVPLHP